SWRENALFEERKKNIINERAMKILVILALTLLACTRGSAQADSAYHQETQDLVQYLDVRDFEVSQNCLGDYEFQAGDRSIRQYEMYDSDKKFVGYVEESKELHTPYSYYYNYDTKGRLRYLSVSFDGVSIGNSYRYDSLGCITEIKDYSRPYKFKLNNLIEKMSSEYRCDLLNKRRLVSVHRSEGERDLKKPWYSVFYLENERSHYGDRYLIDGTTGETLYVLKHEEWNECGSGDLSDFYTTAKGLPTSIEGKYLYELNKKKQAQKKKGAKKKVGRR
ncbi:hypothetical protein, partial [Hoylesella loescheii]